MISTEMLLYCCSLMRQCIDSICTLPCYKRCFTACLIDGKRYFVQLPNDRKSAELSLRPFTTCTEYAPHLKVCCCECETTAQPAGVATGNCVKPRLSLVQRGWHGGVAPCPVRQKSATFHAEGIEGNGLQAILDNSENPYAQCFAASSLLTVITEHAVRCGDPMRTV